MASDELIRRSAEKAARIKQKSAYLSLETERQIAHRDGPLNYILASAHQEAVDAFVELADVEPNDVDKIRKLQNDIKRYSDLGLWLQTAVVSGAQTMKELEPEIYEEWATQFSAGEEGE